MATQPEIVFEDNHLLVINKPSGVLVQGDQTGDEPLVEIGKKYIKEKYKKPGAVFLGVVHRLDRPVSGVTVFARTSKALTRMNALFKEREIRKVYWALVKHRPSHSEDKLVHWLVKNEKTNKTKAYSKEYPKALRSELQYRMVKELNGIFMLEVIPLTGRAHQIRVQLSDIGCPIMGDIKYGFEYPLEDASIALHARELTFAHPVKGTSIHLSAAPQNDVWKPFL